jgi:TP901 family phage tail tape measure protein
VGVPAQRQAQVSITSSAAKIDRGLSDARRKLRAFEREQVSAAKKAEREAAKASKQRGARISGVGVAVAEKAVEAITSNVGEIVDTQRAIDRLGVSGSMNAEQMAAFNKELMNVSESTGVSRGELTAGAAEYVKITGDAAGATESLRLFGEVANATGAAQSDIAATAAAMRQNLKIDPNDFRAAFDVLVTQGKKGAIELSDLSQQMANMAPSFQQFDKGTGVKGLATLGASIQVVRHAFGSADEAATGFRGLMTEIVRHSANLEQYGIKVFDKNPKTGVKTLRPFLNIVDQIGKSKMMKDPGALIEALGEEKAVRALNSIYNNMEELKGLRDDSLNSDAVAKDNAKYMETSTAKLAMSWEKIKNTVAAAFTPERIEAFAAAIGKAAEAAKPIIDLAASILGGLNNVGKSVRGAISEAPNLYEASVYDRAIASDGDPSNPMVKQARNRVVDHDAFATARDNIMEGEIGEKTSPESIRRAFEAKYNNLGVGNGTTAASMAGETYLKAAGVSDPVEIAARTNAKITNIMQSSGMLEGIKTAIREGFAGASVNLDGEKVHKGTANAKGHRR